MSDDPSLLALAQRERFATLLSAWAPLAQPTAEKCPMIAHELVSIQPMPVPVGAIFYLDVVYGDDRHYRDWQEWAYRHSDRRGPREILEVLDPEVTITRIDEKEL